MELMIAGYVKLTKMVDLLTGNVIIYLFVHSLFNESDNISSSVSV